MGDREAKSMSKLSASKAVLKGLGKSKMRGESSHESHQRENVNLNLAWGPFMADQDCSGFMLC